MLFTLMKKPPITIKGIKSTGTRAIASSIFGITTDRNKPYAPPAKYVIMPMKFNSTNFEKVYVLSPIA